MKDTSHHAPCDVLLATGSAGGTIAAVRELSKAGLRVAVVQDQFFCPAAWSRSVSKSYRGPQERNSHDFLEMLLAIGAASPGQVLLPTSDETAWLYTQHAAKLSRYFLLRQPPLETLKRILDKNLLSEAATRAGIEVLPTFAPSSLQDLQDHADKLDYPVLIKPRAQVGRTRNDKGMTASNSEELKKRYLEYVTLEGEGEHSEGVPLLSDSLPLVQRYVKIGDEGVCSVSGYIDETGELFVTRRSTKILQRSQPAGVGVCFESLPEDTALSDAVRRLCRELGFFGIFEVEFIRYNGLWAVIDFNPRLFNQAGMDALRGVPLALFAYLDAAGKTSELREAVAKARAHDPASKAVFYDRFTLPAIMIAKFLTRRAPLQEVLGWRRWAREHAAHAVDFAIDRNDLMPAFAHICSELILGLKAIPRFLRFTTPVAPTTEPMMVKVSE